MGSYGNGFTETESESVQRGPSSMSIYLREVRGNSLLTAEEEVALALRVEAGDESARARMIESNLRLVIKISKRYINKGLPFTDVVEEGNIGLIKAVERFKPEKGCRFSTYATWWIRQSIERALINQVRTVRLPVHVSDDLDRLRRATEHLRRKLDRVPNDKELAEHTGLTEAYVTRLLSISLSVLSLDQAFDSDNDSTIGDRLESPEFEDPVEELHVRKLIRVMMKKLDYLNQREREILQMRFGLDGEAPMTLEMIGTKYGVTRERIRQIQLEAMTKLKAEFDQEGIEVA